MPTWFKEQIAELAKVRQTLWLSGKSSDKTLLTELNAYLDMLEQGLNTHKKTVFINKQFKLHQAFTASGLPPSKVLSTLHPIEGNLLWYFDLGDQQGLKADALKRDYAATRAYVKASCDYLDQLSPNQFQGSIFQKWFGGQQYDQDAVSEVETNFLMIKRALDQEPIVLAKMPQGVGFDDAYGAAYERGERVNFRLKNSSKEWNVIYLGSIFWERPTLTSQSERDNGFDDGEIASYHQHLRALTIIHEMSHLIAGTKDVKKSAYNPWSRSQAPSEAALAHNFQKWMKYFSGHAGTVETFYGAPMSKILARDKPELARDNADNYGYFALNAGVPEIRARFINRELS